MLALDCWDVEIDRAAAVKKPASALRDASKCLDDVASKFKAAGPPASDRLFVPLSTLQSFAEDRVSGLEHGLGIDPRRLHSRKLTIVNKTFTFDDGGLLFFDVFEQVDCIDRGLAATELAEHLNTATKGTRSELRDAQDCLHALRTRLRK